MMEILEKNSEPKKSSLKSPPCISIYVDNSDDDCNNNHQLNIDDQQNDENKIIKCKSMQNMKLSTRENDRYKQNLLQFNNQNSSKLPNAADFIRHNQTQPSNYRKCLSRVNLNLYQMSTPTNNNNNDKLSQESALKPHTNPKIIKLNQTNARGLKVRNFPINAVSIMNLEHCVDNLGLESDGLKITIANNSRRNLLLNKSHTNLSQNFSLGSMSKKAQNNNNNMLINGSNLNLFKSSNSLNALDLELMESVSVGSFDRLSLYSCGANSESDLNQYFFVDTVDNTMDTSKNDTGEVKFDKNRSNRNQVTSSRYFVNSVKLNNFKENRVIDWLENI